MHARDEIKLCTPINKSINLQLIEINMRYVEDLDENMEIDQFQQWPTIKQPFLNEEAEKNLRLLVTDIILLDQLRFKGNDRSMMQFNFRATPQGTPIIWFGSFVIMHLANLIGKEAKKLNDKRFGFNF